MEPEQNFGAGPSWSPCQGREVEASRLRFEVDRAAGPAAYGFAEARSFVEWKPRGTMQTRPVSPAGSWATILSDDPMFDVETILACCSQAMGILEMQARNAEEREHQYVRRVLAWMAALTGSGLPPLAKWTARAAGTIVVGVAVVGVTYWLGWR